MLFDLLPHLARLLPVADKFFSTRSASDKAHEAALAALADDIRGDTTRSTEAQATLRRQMQEHTAHLGEVALDVTRLRMVVEGADTRVAKLESSIIAIEAKATSAVKLLGAALALLIVTFALLIILVVHALR